MRYSGQQLIQKAQAFLQQRRPADAIKCCKQLLKQNPRDVNGHHLLALAFQMIGEHKQAVAAFQSAIQLAPKDSRTRISFGAYLRSQGRNEEAERQLRKALRLDPASEPARHSLVLTLMALGRLEEAENEAEFLTKSRPAHPAYWELRAAVAQKQGAVQRAIDFCKEGLSKNPQAPRLHYSLAQLLRQETEFAGAAAAYEQARASGFDRPELYQNWGESLLDSGELNDALECLNVGLQRFSDNAVLHRVSARLHAEAGAPGDPLRKLADAVERSPGDARLVQTLVELANRLQRQDEGNCWLSAARQGGCPDTPGIAVLEAQALAHSEDNVAAISRFEKALSAYPNVPHIEINFAMHLLKHGEPTRARERCDAVLAQDPANQLALAFKTTALQLLDDPLEYELCDYDRMVSPIVVPVPKGFTSGEEFFSELSEVLNLQHKTNAQPIEQSVRGGTQTNGFLFRLKHPLLTVLEQQLREAVLSVVCDFPADGEHPYWRQRAGIVSTSDIRFSGAWSVRLGDQGFHANHIHSEGWISSALYVSLPDEVKQGYQQDGHIQFGSPMSELGLEIAPRRVVKPEVGTLVLFPSYMWHGTIPFQSEQPRTTVAFDVGPRLS